MASRRIVIVAFEGVQALDITGPSEVFSLADRASADPTYELELIAGDGAPIRTSSGIEITPRRSLEPGDRNGSTRSSSRVAWAPEPPPPTSS